ncbi:TRAP transporter substrate-binding protein [Rhodoferax sp.]|uniref:TRAP transporter substrate-binding protein n=1 Tax=Rhodoferax sp. TaxID=50421 RepID=UPI0026127DE7|nr:TRAP transporter substrate-binding protein [Rhodoferax sp.]MDD3937111.1 TRAP transporter substrate-binding protein [Rhodoferax sp.]
MKRLVLKSLVAAVALAAFGMASAQDIRERTFKFATNGAGEHPSVAGMKKFSELVAAKSGGKMQVKMFVGGILGSDQANISAIQGGTLEMAVMNTGILASVAKELAIFDFPFLFANNKESDALVDGPVGKKLHQKLEAKGLIGLSYWELGYREITNSKRPLLKVEDIEGLKLRVIPNPINVAWVKALGANPTPLPFPEVYSALEQKAIDGQENPVSVIATSKFWEVQKYMTMTNHQYNPQSVIFSKKIWDSLSPAERKILDDSADEATKYQREQARAAVAVNMELLKKNGMAVSEFTPAEVAKLREKMKPVIAQFSANVGEETVAEVQAELAKMRK